MISGEQVCVKTTDLMYFDDFHRLSCMTSNHGVPYTTTNIKLIIFKVDVTQSLCVYIDVLYSFTLVNSLPLCVYRYHAIVNYVFSICVQLPRYYYYVAICVFVATMLLAISHCVLTGTMLLLTMSHCLLTGTTLLLTMSHCVFTGTMLLLICIIVCSHIQCCC